MEQETIQEYLTYQEQHGHSDLTVDVHVCGLFACTSEPKLAATPNGIVHDPSNGIAI